MNPTVKTYFDAFNASDVDGMLACLSDDVAHHMNEGRIRSDCHIPDGSMGVC